VKLNAEGVIVDLEYEMTIIYLNMIRYRSESFFLAKDYVNQILYMMDMSMKPKQKLTTKNVPSVIKSNTDA
jgi:hypothetical protein